MANISLDEVTELVRELLRSKENAEKAASIAVIAMNRVKYIEDVLMPNTLREIDMMKFTLSDGRVVSVEPNISASISELSWPEAEKWLVENQCDGIIKNQVITEFDKGQNEAAVILLRIIHALVTYPNFFHFIEGIVDSQDDTVPSISRALLMGTEELPLAEIKAKKSINPQTLKAFVRECYRKGMDVPEDLFSLFITDHVKIK